jgi:hypothetical protein
MEQTNENGRKKVGTDIPQERAVLYQPRGLDQQSEVKEGWRRAISPASDIRQLPEAISRSRSRNSTSHLFT